MTETLPKIGPDGVLTRSAEAVKADYAGYIRGYSKGATQAIKATREQVLADVVEMVKGLQLPSSDPATWANTAGKNAIDAFRKAILEKLEGMKP